MHNSKVLHDTKSSRDSTFVMVRRGLFRPEHWTEMSGNAAKLFVWLLSEAHWSGQKRGWVETTFEDMARANGWSYSTAQRIVKELESKPYIKIERSANQHNLTRIQILKYDTCEHDSVPVKSDRSTESAPVSGPVSGSVKSDRSNSASPQNPQDLQASKKLRSKEKVSHDRPDRLSSTGKTPNLFLKGRAWDELEITSLPVVFEPFVRVVEKNPRGADEHFVDWSKRIMDLCAQEGIEYPRVFYKRFKQAERELESQDDPYGEVSRVAGPRGLGPEWAHLMKDESETQERPPAAQGEELVIDAEIAQQLLSQFPEAWDIPKSLANVAA